MPSRKNILPYKSLGDILRDSTRLRVSKDAQKEAASILEEKTQEVITKANLLAQSSKRKTLREKDIRLAWNQSK